MDRVPSFHNGSYTIRSLKRKFRGDYRYTFNIQSSLMNDSFRTYIYLFIFSRCQMAFINTVFSCHVFEVPVNHLTLTVKLCKTKGLAGRGFEVHVQGEAKKG